MFSLEASRFPSFSNDNDRAMAALHHQADEQEGWESRLDMLEPRPLLFFGGLDSMVA